MPSGPGVISDHLAARIVATIPPSVSSFLLTCSRDSQSIISQQRMVRANTIQLCGQISLGQYDELRLAMPGIYLVQVIHVLGENSIDEVRRIAPKVDGVLLDSGNPNAKIQELGGTGRVHDWVISKVIRDSISVPVFLAGGLNAANVGEAIRRVDPFGVDVCSGVRTDGELDREKLAAFFDAVSAFD